MLFEKISFIISPVCMGGTMGGTVSTAQYKGANDELPTWGMGLKVNTTFARNAMLGHRSGSVSCFAFQV